MNNFKCNNMKNLNKIKLILFSVLCFISCSSLEIIYKPQGMTDKGLPEIHLKKKCDIEDSNSSNPFNGNNSSDTTVQIYLETPNLNVRCYELNRQTLNTLKNYILNYKGISSDSNALKRYTDWGSYGVIVKHNGGKKYLFLRGYKESCLFFAKQLEFVNKSELYFSEIELLAKYQPF